MNHKMMIDNPSQAMFDQSSMLYDDDDISPGPRFHNNFKDDRNSFHYNKKNAGSAL